MPTKVIKPTKVTKDQAKRLIEAGDRLWKRAKRPENYNATPKDVAEIERLTEALDTAIRRITKKP